MVEFIEDGNGNLISASGKDGIIFSEMADGQKYVSFNFAGTQILKMYQLVNLCRCIYTVYALVHVLVCVFLFL